MANIKIQSQKLTKEEIMEKYRIKEVCTDVKKSHFIVEELVVKWSFFGLKYKYQPYITYWYNDEIVRFSNYKSAKSALIRKIESNL